MTKDLKLLERIRSQARSHIAAGLHDLSCAHDVQSAQEALKRIARHIRDANTLGCWGRFRWWAHLHPFKRAEILELVRLNLPEDAGDTLRKRLRIQGFLI